jgi:nucleoside-diphosphate-sugar epimerase
MSEITVTGGTGFVGRHLIQALLERGDRVRVLALPDEDTTCLEHQHVAVYRGDVRFKESLDPPMRGAAGVVHLAGLMGAWQPAETYWAVNVTGTRNVCEAARAAGVSRIVHMSSSVVYGPGRGTPVDETAPLQPLPDPYPVTKAAGDRLVQQMIAEQRVPAVIVRPDQIFGPGDQLHFARVADRIRAGRGVVVGTGKNVYPLIYITDAIQGLLLALDHPRASGHVYNLSHGSPLTQQEYLDAIADEIGARRPRLHVPYRALYAAGYLAEAASSLTGSRLRPPTTRFGVAFMGTNGWHAIGKARRDLGFTPRVGLRDGVRLTAAWYRAGCESSTDTYPSGPAVIEGVR